MPSGWPGRSWRSAHGGEDREFVDRPRRRSRSRGASSASSVAGGPAQPLPFAETWDLWPGADVPIALTLQQPFPADEEIVVVTWLKRDGLAWSNSAFSIRTHRKKRGHAARIAASGCPFDVQLLAPAPSKADGVMLD